MHYVIGDIHGCMKEMQLLIEKIERQDDDAVIYFLGDFIDRGPNTPAVMEWVAKNITLNGKYRSVRGNHDMEAYEWYEHIFLPWREDENHDDVIPETNYDFSEVVDLHFHRDIKLIEPFFEKVKNAMPYNVKLDIETKWGKNVTYRLCHADYCYKDDCTEEKQKQTNLYYRNFWGNHLADEIVIHGHTPTISRDYALRGICRQDRKGMIGYRDKMINLDGGCCFINAHANELCMLCGICLETLEEFYPYTIEERVLQGAEILVNTNSVPITMGSSKKQTIEALYEVGIEKAYSYESNYFRNELLKKIGSPDYVPSMQQPEGGVAGLFLSNAN